MTAKRFSKYVPDSYNYTSIITIVDNKTGKRSGSIDDFVDMMNALHKENEELKKENQGIQDKVIRLLDFVEIKQCVTRTEIKKWWNDD